MPFVFRTKNKCNPAYRVISALGGVRPTSRIVGVSPSAVSRWMMTAAEGGTGQGILRAARQLLADAYKPRQEKQVEY